MIKMKIDPVLLTADLVRCPSVTPEEGGAIDLLEQLLEKNGFSCTRIVRGQVSNCLLYTSPRPRDVEESRMPSSA